MTESNKYLPANLLLISISLVALSHFRSDYIWIKQTLAGTCLLLSLIPAIPFFLKKKLQDLFSIDSLFILAFSFWACISWSWALVPSKTVKSSLLIITSVAAFVLARTLLTSNVQTMRFVFVSILTGVLVAAYGILQNLIDRGWFTMPLDQYGFKDMASTFGLSNFSADFLVMILPLCTVAVLGQRRLLGRRLALLSSLIILGYLLLSKVRAGYAALLISLILACILALIHRNKGLTRRRKAMIIVAALALVTIILGVARTAANSFRSITSWMDLQSPPIKIRLHTWIQALLIIRDNPVLGVGLGNYEIISPRYYDSVQYEMTLDSNTMLDRTHNEFLNIACDLGIPGLLLFLAFLAFLLTRAFGFLFRRRTDDYFWIVASLICALAAELTAAFFAFPFQMPGSGFLFFITAGILSGLVNEHDVTTNYLARLPKVTGRVLRCSGLLVPALALPFSVIWSYRFMQADNDYRFGQMLGARSALREAALTYERGLWYEPSSDKIQYALAMTHLRMGLRQQAIIELRRFLDQAPHFYKARKEYALLLADLGETDQSLEELDRIARECPHQAPDIRLYRAFVHFIKNEVVQAYDEICAAINDPPKDTAPCRFLSVTIQKLEPQLLADADYWFYRACTESWAGLPSDASNSIKRCLELDPSRVSAVRKIAKMSIMLDSSMGQGKLQESGISTK